MKFRSTHKPTIKIPTSVILILLFHITVQLKAALPAIGASANGSITTMETTPSPNWIWQEEDGPKDTWMCFRKTVDLEEKPASAITQIAAESKYWLWVNGELVVFEGQLKRDRLEQTYYDEIDLAPYLQKGTNTLAVQVWYWGREAFSHHDAGMGGLLFSADVDGKKLVSDASWKVNVHPAYEHSTSGGQPNFRLSTWNVRFNAINNTTRDWQYAAYDDSDWAAATVKEVPENHPWNKLVKRPFPQWKDSGLQGYTTVTKTEDGSVLEGILPYNARISAYLKVKAPAGKVINIQTDQYDGWYDFGEGPANRVEYITREGIQDFETLVWMSGNRVEYTLPEGVEVIAIKYRELGYPSEFAGAFSCNDAFYDSLWIMARRTLYINMFDNFMDCPDRERALWWGDVVNQSGECFYTLDTVSHALIRKSIRTLVAWQREDSTLFSPPSTIWNAELPQQMLASIGWYGFWNYFMNTGDSATIRHAYPAVKKYLEIWEMAPNGLVDHRRGAWDWGDWGTNIDIAILDNAWYYLALKAAIPMALISGHPSDTLEYLANMQSIAGNFSREFWDEQKQYFKSKTTPEPDDRANAMAVLAGLASPEHYAGIQKVLFEKTYASPYMEKYVLEALCTIGAETLALERMKNRYTEMVNSEYNTLWEVWSGLKEGTINHGWNAPNTVLSQHIAGISPTSPGWKSYQVLPKMGGLSTVNQTVPSVAGLVEVKHSITSDTFTTLIDSPEGTEATVGIPKLFDYNTIKVNNRWVWKKNGKIKNRKGVRYLSENDNYYLFKVAPGHWEVSAIQE